ncbi:MAG: hypothetical protein IJ355_09200 [Prevotella sp.]|nr:hypothetical protein [Prevotella sp.]
MKNSEIISQWAKNSQFFACIFFSLSIKKLYTKREKCAIISAEKFCRKALTALQRGARCIATGTPLQADGHAARDQRGPYGKTAEFFSAKNGVQMLKSGAYRHFFEQVSSVKFLILL